MRVDSLRAIACFLLLWGCAEVEDAAAAMPDRFTDTELAGGLDSATSMAIAPDGPRGLPP